MARHQDQTPGHTNLQGTQGGAQASLSTNLGLHLGGREQGAGMILLAASPLSRSPVLPAPFHISACGPGVLQDSVGLPPPPGGLPASPGPLIPALYAAQGIDSGVCLSPQTMGFQRPAGAGVSPRNSA